MAYSRFMLGICLVPSFLAVLLVAMLLAGCSTPPPLTVRAVAEPVVAEPWPTAEDAPIFTWPEPPLVIFAFDSAEITPQAHRDLWAWVDGMWEDVDLAVVGHADTQGDARYNEALGLRRAQAVADVLMRMGVAPAGIAIGTAGDTDSRVGLTPMESHAISRRVELFYDD